MGQPRCIDSVALCPALSCILVGTRLLGKNSAFWIVPPQCPEEGISLFCAAWLTLKEEDWVDNLLQNIDLSSLDILEMCSAKKV